MANYRIIKIPSSYGLGNLSKEERNNEIERLFKNGTLRATFKHNLVPSILRNSFATLIAGTTVTPTFKANICALGSDNTAPANTDTELGTEVLRAEFDSRYAVDNVAYLDVFFTRSALGTFNLEEVGVFVDGLVGTPDSGFLFSRLNHDEVLNGNEDLSVNVTFTISG